MHNEQKVETRLPSACILAIPMLCGRASRPLLSVHLQTEGCVSVRRKASSFARLALYQAMCALQMCLL